MAHDEVAYVPWGEWTQPTAHRKNVSGFTLMRTSNYDLRDADIR